MRLMSSIATSHNIPSVPRYALSLDEAAASLGLCRRTVADLVASGRLSSIRVGRRRLVPVTELARFIACDVIKPHEVPSNG
jgi:excisionase family DNA binding protein